MEKYTCILVNYFEGICRIENSYGKRVRLKIKLSNAELLL